MLADSGPAAAMTAEPSILESSASAVIEIIPEVMDTMRASLRSHVGDQLTVPQFRCLAFISRHGGCSVSEVSSFMGVTKATASVMVDRLMRAGAILVVNDIQDRRRSLLHISCPGRTQLQAIRAEARKDFAHAMSGLSAHELDTLNAGLEILRKTFRREQVPLRDMKKLISNPETFLG
jgi:DNA-binding MarR family transcriptional regulator